MNASRDLHQTHAQLIKILAHLNPDVLAAIGTIVNNPDPAGHDGWTTRASGSDSTGASGGETTTSVEAAALYERIDTDDVYRSAVEADALIRRALDLVIQADLRRIIITKARQAGRAEQAPSCVNCGDPAIWPDRPRAKAGRCQRCWWFRHRNHRDWTVGDGEPATNNAPAGDTIIDTDTQDLLPIETVSCRNLT
ncbi:MAG: hypothetical protein M3Y91_06635 [Actinomycetota bacterium]|nr:hypothetical protein [Actinomycetota bacterium]